MKKISTIFFDAGGVLFDTKIKRKERIINILNSLKIDNRVIDQGIKLADKFLKEIKDKDILVTNWDEEKAIYFRYYTIIAETIYPNNFSSLRDQLFIQTYYVNHCELFPEVITILSNLKMNYKLGVISNAFPSMDWIFDKLNIRKYFLSITISAFAGACKPKPLIFTSALKSLRVSANESIFIDNQLRHVEAARKLGFVGVHINRKEKMTLDILNNIEALINNKFE